MGCGTLALIEGHSEFRWIRIKRLSSLEHRMSTPILDWKMGMAWVETRQVLYNVLF